MAAYSSSAAGCTLTVRDSGVRAAWRLRVDRPSWADPILVLAMGHSWADEYASGMGAVDEYFSTLEGEARSAYERIRDLAVAEVPGAEQGTSYGMAALKYRGKPLIGFRAAKDHLSVFPFSSAAVEAVNDELRGDVSKGTVRFRPDQPLPDSVVLGLVRSRVAEIDKAR